MPTVDGDLSDWTSAQLLNAPGTTTPGYLLYGSLSGGVLTFAIKAPTTIGAYTTVWLDSDQQATTGYKVFGIYGGYDYNINFATDGKPYLYTGADGQNLVSPTPLTYAYSADKTAVEFSIPVSQLGNTTGVKVLADVNNTTFLPGDYAAGPYSVLDTTSLPVKTNTGHKIGIVYSETTAANFFSTMAYSQLFMAAQNQATQAGVTFDLLSESDLTNLSKLANYDALVFPSFRNVPTDKLQAITDTLTTLVKNYQTGLIAAGDFMTNDATGAPLAGDSYARMKALLDVSHTGSASGVNVDVVAASTTNPIMTGYTSGEVIHSYTNIGTSYVTSTDGTGVTLANQVVNGQSQAAVLATQTSGKNVYFATEGMLADNNMLAHAIDYVTAPTTGPSLSLHISRDKAIVAARVDMDQAMQMADVIPESGPGIYDKLLPILAQWKQAYNFVASYYIDIGNDLNNGVATDWTYSKKYYNQLLAMGNEIGSHSISHPDDTNLLTPAQIQTEFQGSRTTIESQLGLSNIGAAIPGMPDTLATARDIEQYYPYITGGAALIGAGYPGAIGYLSPSASDTKSVYIAPDMSFDFTLIDYQKLTIAQAEAAWTKEWNSLTQHADLPVIVWPWHDYGAASWPLDGGTTSNYNQQMFTDVIARAAQAGSEFVTLADLAQRVATFDQSGVITNYNATAKVLTATVTATAGDLGKFALDLGTGHTVSSVAGWYAYDADSLFVPKAGGTFAIAVDAPAADVSHLSKLADRSDLISVTGDGTNLSFSEVGDGTFQVSLQSHAGKMIAVTGADSATLNGNLLTLTENGLGQHNLAITMTPTITVTAAGETIFGTDGADTLNDGNKPVTLVGGTGNDIYLVSNGGDTIVEAANSGTDRVQSSVSFTLPANVENLTLTGSAVINGTGNALDNVIVGNAGKNVLDGKGGNDTYTGGLGADTFVFAKAGQGKDTVTDFSRAQGDKLAVHASDYNLPVGALNAGYLDANLLGLGLKNHAEFVYNTATGVLSWDDDGIGAHAPVAIATLTNKALLAASDFLIVA